MPFAFTGPPRGTAQPSLGSELNAGPTPQSSEGDRFARWKSFLDQPEVSAFLLQFGAQMLQPSKGGFLGALGESAASGGQAVGRMKTLEMAEAKETRETQQQEFENQLATEQLGIQRQRLDLERERIKIAATRLGGSRGNTLTNTYERMLKDYELRFDQWKAIADNTPPGQPLPPPPSIPTLEDAQTSLRLNAGEISDQELAALGGKFGKEATLDALRRRGVPEEVIQRADRIMAGDTPPTASGTTPTPPVEPLATPGAPTGVSDAELRQIAGQIGQARQLGQSPDEAIRAAASAFGVPESIARQAWEKFQDQFELKGLGG